MRESMNRIVAILLIVLSLCIFIYAERGLWSMMYLNPQLREVVKDRVLIAISIQTVLTIGLTVYAYRLRKAVLGKPN